MHRDDKATIRGLIFAVLCLGIAIGLLLGMAVYGIADDTPEPEETETPTPEPTENTTSTDTPDCEAVGASIDYPECNDELPTHTETDAGDV